MDNSKDSDVATGELDWLKAYQFYGRPARLLVGLADAVYPDGFERAYTALIESFTTHLDRFTFALKGRQTELDKPISSLKFLGNNVEPDGLEGNVDLKDTLKPVGIGRVLNATPRLCNGPKLIYAVSLPTGISVHEMGSDFHVFDKGVELFGSVVSLATLQSTNPAQGTYSACSEGYIRLGSLPAGTVTCSFAQAGRALTSHPAVLINDILTAEGYNSGDDRDMLDANSLTGLSADKWERGLYPTPSTTISQVIDLILAPLGYWYFDAMGLLRTGVLSDPAGKTAVFVADSNIISFQIEDSADTTAGIPAKSVGITYARNNTVQTDCAGSVSAERKDWLKEQSRTASLPSTHPVQPLAEDLVLDTCIVSETSEVLTILEQLYCAGREIVTIGISKTDFNAARVLPPGSIVSVNLDGRFNYSDRPTLLIGMTINWVEEAVTLRCWS